MLALSLIHISFAAFGQLAAGHAGQRVGDPGALVLGRQIDLGGADGQAGGAALALEYQGAAVGGIDVREQDLALVVGIDSGDLGPQGDGVLGGAGIQS